MFKKLLIAGVVLAVGFSLLKSTSLGSLFHVAWKDARIEFDRAVSPGVQIKQLHVEIDKVDKDIRKQLGVLAAQEVEFQVLVENAAELKGTVAKLKVDVATMARNLEERTATPVSRRDRAAIKLDTAIAAYENKKVELKGKEQLIEAKKQTLEAAHSRISEMRDQKENLRVTAAKLETRLALVKHKEVKNKIEIDDSQVTRCNVLARKIETRLREREKVAELDVQYGYNIEVPTMEKEPRPAAEVLKAAKQALADDSDETVTADKR